MIQCPFSIVNFSQQIKQVVSKTYSHQDFSPDEVFHSNSSITNGGKNVHTLHLEWKKGQSWICPAQIELV
jgi:hypothetical protein